MKNMTPETKERLQEIENNLIVNLSFEKVQILTMLLKNGKLISNWRTKLKEIDN